MRAYDRASRFRRSAGAIGASSAGVALSGWWPPETPHADDEEFATGGGAGSAGLPSGWVISDGAVDNVAIDPYTAVAVNSRLSTNSFRRGWLIAQPLASGELYVSKPYVQTTDYSWFARLSYNNRSAVAAANNDFTCGLRLSQTIYSANDGIMIAINESDPGIIQAEFLKKVGGVVTSIGTTASLPANERAPFEGVIIQRIGATNTWHGWVVMNNGSCVYLGSNVESSITMERVGVWFSNASNATPANMIMGADFVRRRDDALFLP